MRFEHVCIESVAYVRPPDPLTSADIEQQLQPLYQKLRLPEGRLELMTGIERRHFWNSGIRPSQASAEAGRKALEKSRFTKDQMELLMHCGVCRDCMEPATAAFVHQELGMPGRTQIFDVSNACLGFANAMAIAASMIESRQIDRALLTSGEDGRPLVEQTIKTLLGGEFTRKSIKPYFANFTIGAGAAAMVLCHDSLIDEKPHRLLGAVAQTDSEANRLCQGDRAADGMGLEMLTDAEALLEAGVALASRCWTDFESETGWTRAAPDRFVCHQVGRTHQRKIFEALGLDRSKDFTTYEWMGNVGSVSLPLTLAAADEARALDAGDKVALFGIGSGLSCMMLAVEW